MGPVPVFARAGAAVAIAAMLVSAAPAAAAPGGGWHGMNASGVFFGPRSDDGDAQQRTLEALRGTGVTHARVDAAWPEAEPSKPPPAVRIEQGCGIPALAQPEFDWRRFDRIAEGLARNDLRWSPMLGYAPSWARDEKGSGHHPPDSAADFARYAEAFARRYGADGEFWRRETCGEPPPVLPVERYEIWNEPNLGHFWRPRPDAAKYGELFIAARDAIKRVQPGARVIVGGLWHGGLREYVSRLQAAQPAALAGADGVGYHPYGQGVEEAMAGVRRLRQALTAAGHPALPIYVTEVGWPTQGSGWLGAQPVPDFTRAGNLALLGDALAYSDCSVASFEPFTWVTPQEDPTHDEDWLGIANRDGGPTETSRAYAVMVDRHLQQPRTAAPLPICAAKPPRRARLLPLSLETRRGVRCASGRVLYEGMPLSDTDVRLRPGRARARTDLRGRFRICGRRLRKVVAEVPRAARGAARLRR